jgi:hypothetical protein
MAVLRSVGENPDRCMVYRLHVSCFPRRLRLFVAKEKEMGEQKQKETKPAQKQDRQPGRVY